MKAYEDIFEVRGGVPEKLGADGDPLASSAHRALDLAVIYAHEVVNADGHWCGELRSNATITAEYVFLRQALSLDLRFDSDALCHWFFSEQKPDGSWSIAPGDYPGDISTTTEAYLALCSAHATSPEIQNRSRRCGEGSRLHSHIFGNWSVSLELRTRVACRAHIHASLGPHQYLQAVILGTQYGRAVAHSEPSLTHFSVA